MKRRKMCINIVYIHVQGVRCMVDRADTSHPNCDDYMRIFLKNIENLDRGNGFPLFLYNFFAFLHGKFSFFSCVYIQSYILFFCLRRLFRGTSVARSIASITRRQAAKKDIAFFCGPKCYAFVYVKGCPTAYRLEQVQSCPLTTLSH